MNFKSNLGILRILAVAEGISYLLFALTMPLKRIYHISGPNKMVGYAHGFLFLAYCIWVILVSSEKKWNAKTTLLSGVASLLPFGTFVADSKIFKKQ